MNLYALKDTRASFKPLHAWADRPGHSQPAVFTTRAEAEAHRDAMKYADAKHLAIVEFSEVPHCIERAPLGLTDG